MRLIAILITALTLSACGTPGACEQRTDYQTAKVTRKVVPPEGKDSLDETAEIKVPTASTPPDVDQSCLEKPPRFFDEVPAA